jgi:hypothetical protein
MVTYKGRKCGHLLEVKPKKTTSHLLESRSDRAPPGKRTITIRCPQCGTLNSFEVNQ